MQLIDLSHPIEKGMPVYPGDEAPQLEQIKWLAKDAHNNHRLQISMHAGTHLDAPLHMLATGEPIAALPLTSFIGPAVLLDVREEKTIAWKPSYEEFIFPGTILLLFTGHDEYYGQPRYFTEHPVLDPNFAERLVAKRIKMLGMDIPSPDAPPFPIHKRLLSAGIYILENLTNLAALLNVGSFELLALPLKMATDGSPVRAIARL